MVTAGILPFRENSHGRGENRTRDLMISSQTLWSVDHAAGQCFIVNFRLLKTIYVHLLVGYLNKRITMFHRMPNLYQGGALSRQRQGHQTHCNVYQFRQFFLETFQITPSKHIITVSSVARHSHFAKPNRPRNYICTWRKRSLNNPPKQTS